MFVVIKKKAKIKSKNEFAIIHQSFLFLPFYFDLFTCYLLAFHLAISPSNAATAFGFAAGVAALPT